MVAGVSIGSVERPLRVGALAPAPPACFMDGGGCPEGSVLWQDKRTCTRWQIVKNNSAISCMTEEKGIGSAERPLRKKGEVISYGKCEEIYGFSCRKPAAAH